MGKGETMSDYEAAVAKAAEIGREHGENAAAEWVYESSGWDRRVALAKMDSVYPFEECTIHDVAGYPEPALSGEWADRYSSYDLERDVFGPDQEIPDDFGGWASEFYDAYETAFSDAVETAVRAACEDATRE